MRFNKKGMIFVNFAFILLLSSGIILLSANLFLTLSKSTISLNLKSNAYQYADSGIIYALNNPDTIIENKISTIKFSKGEVIIEKYISNGKTIITATGIATIKKKTTEHKITVVI